MPQFYLQKKEFPGSCENEMSPCKVVRAMLTCNKNPNIVVAVIFIFSFSFFLIPTQLYQNLPEPPISPQCKTLLQLSMFYKVREGNRGKHFIHWTNLKTSSKTKDSLEIMILLNCKIMKIRSFPIFL